MQAAHRVALLAAERVGHVHLLDASAPALSVAKQNLAGVGNVTFHLGSVSEIPLPDESLDFAYSLGVLHHVPDTLGALQHIASKLKPGAPFLVYLVLCARQQAALVSDHLETDQRSASPDLSASCEDAADRKPNNRRNDLLAARAVMSIA